MFDVAGARDARDLRLLEPWMLTRNVRRAYVDQGTTKYDFFGKPSKPNHDLIDQSNAHDVKWQMALNRFDSPLRVARVTNCLSTSNMNHPGGEL